MADENANQGAGGGTPPAAGGPSGGVPPVANADAQAELHKAIEKARGEERTKLREQTTRLEEEVRTLKELVASQKANLEELKAKLKAFESAKTDSGGIDVEKAIDSAVSAVKARFESEFGQQLSDLKAQLNSEKSARTSLEHERLRSRMIEEAGGRNTLIPELVTGATEEEIRVSIERSKAVLGRYAPSSSSSGSSPGQGSQANNGTAAGSGGEGGAGIPPMPNASGNAGTPATPPSVRGMSVSDFAKNRETLKKQAVARYKTGNPIVSG